MATHPARNRLQLLNRSIAFEVIAPPANECHVVKRVSTTRIDTINAGGGIIPLAKLEVVVNSYTTTWATGCSAYPINDIFNSQYIPIERQGHFPRAVDHTLAHYLCPYSQWVSLFALPLSFCMYNSSSFRIQRTATRTNTLSMNTFPCTKVRPLTFTANRIQSIPTPLVRGEIFKRGGLQHPTLCTCLDGICLLHHDISVTQKHVWGNEVSSSIALEVPA